MNICEACGDGIAQNGTVFLFDGEYMHTFHLNCVPSPDAYTLSRMQSDATQREIQMMSQLGPETYFALKRPAE